MLKTDLIKDILNYLNNNYLTIEQLANQADLHLEQLKALIANSCIPKHSHTITHQIVFHTDIFGDSIITNQQIFYYHPSLVRWAVKAGQYLKTANFNDVADNMKNDFIQELRQTLIETAEAKQVFKYCFNDGGALLKEGVEKVMMEHWPHIMDGTYGVCLKEISAKSVIIKSITVSILEKWVNNTDLEKEYTYNETNDAAELYDKVAACFGPHEISQSTRGRLFNKFKGYSK